MSTTSVYTLNSLTNFHVPFATGGPTSATVNGSSELQDLVDEIERLGGGTLQFQGWVKLRDHVHVPPHVKLDVPGGVLAGGVFVTTDWNFGGANDCVLDFGPVSGTTLQAVSGMGAFTLVFAQPGITANDRSLLQEYPWAVKLDYADGGTIGHLRVHNAHRGIKQEVECGGWNIGIIEIGAYEECYVIDDVRHVMEIDSLDIWQYGMSGFQEDIFYDGSTVGLRIKRADGCNIRNLTTFRVKLIFETPNTAHIPVNIECLSLDGDNAVAMFESGKTVIDNCYSTKTPGWDRLKSDIVVNDGEHSVDNLDITSPAVDAVKVNSGNFSVTGQYCGHMLQPNSRMGAVYSGGHMFVQSLRPDYGSPGNTAARVLPAIAQNAGGSLHIETVAPEGGSIWPGGFPYVNFNSDEDLNFINSPNQPVNNIPGSWTKGYYNT